MWRKASVAALLALAVGYLYHGSPELPEQVLQYISLPNFQQPSQSQSGQSSQTRQTSLEEVISSAWETLISLPSRQWSKVAVGVDHGGEQRLKPGLRKYFCELTLDSNTAYRSLGLSENNKRVTCVGIFQSYPYHPDRFDFYPQLLCRDGLTGRCYWEVKWREKVHISVSYRGIGRKGNSDDCLFGLNDQSWSLICSDEGYSVRNNKRKTVLRLPSSSVSDRVAVYVDCPAGILSFYSVSSDKLIHLYTFYTTFTQPLYPGFGLCFFGSSVSLCSV